MPLIETKGAASAQGFGEFAKTGEAVYIESCFSTWLYTGNGSTQTITNGIDLSTKGGLVWIKRRSSSASHYLADTVRGTSKYLSTNVSSAENWAGTFTDTLTSFNSNGFSLGADGFGTVNISGETYASWTFREQPKFFDVVTYTGNGGVQNISHSLGSVPGCIIVKSTSSAFDWAVYHRSLGATKGVYLNTTQAEQTNNTLWNDTAPTSTQFTVGNSSGPSSSTNANGGTYVAYLFAHNAGGFGLTGTDNVISCGSFTGTGAAGNAITLGYEPQWLLIKRTDSTSDWAMFNNMMGMTLTDDTYLWANLASIENTYNVLAPTATGFVFQDPYLNASGGTYIYIAIRRGPMKTPTTGTSVFQATTWTGTGAALQQNVNINYDSFMQWRRNGGYSTPWMDRLRGFGYSLYTQQTSAEVNQTAFIAGTLRNNFVNFVDGTYNLNGEPWLNYAFVRAPGFFDVVCYTGTGSNRTVSHNLGVVPELMILKQRSNGSNGWCVYSAPVGNQRRLLLDTSDAQSSANAVFWNNTTPTSTVFTVGTAALTNENNTTFVAYLFASCPGVSKVGSYTGTGALQTIDCGFTGGARFVLIKRYDTTGDWWLYDSARGISSGNDPYLFMNSTAAEVTGTNYVDTDSTGFKVTAAAPAGLNANGGTYIFLAIA
jgi:hypothetical protein